MVNVDKALCGTSLGIASLLGVVFLVDLIARIPFGGSSLTTDICVVLASALIIWQGLETWWEL